MPLTRTPAHAAFRLAPPVKASVPFVPNYVSSLALQPFFAGEVLGAFDVHLAQVIPMTRPAGLLCFSIDFERPESKS